QPSGDAYVYANLADRKILAAARTAIRAYSGFMLGTQIPHTLTSRGLRETLGSAVAEGVRAGNRARSWTIGDGCRGDFQRRQRWRFGGYRAGDSCRFSCRCIAALAVEHNSDQAQRVDF